VLCDEAGVPKVDPKTAMTLTKPQLVEALMLHGLQPLKPAAVDN